jgi:hypothetical protein|nr:MAG TPA: hypothetical protein [Caudoviricetes sp.]
MEANGQLNRKIKVVRESKSFKDKTIPWEVIRREKNEILLLYDN